LNIYRYSDRVYDLLAFSGAPNRLRPRDYRAALERHGWTDISITPTRVLERMAFGGVSGSLAPRFRSAACEMNHLSIAVCATRSHR
jgi:hypothetical protein